MKKRILFIALVLMNFAVYAQKGYLRGTILDGDTGEGLIGATVYKEGTQTGAVADFDGNYSLALEPGVHNVVFQFVSYQSQTVTDVEINSDEVTTLDITLSSITEQLDEIVITAKQITDNEVALLSLQKKSPNVVNGISSQAFRKLGDGNLGSAMKRVTGVSVEGGKYVYVRGLGDRYTKTTLNEMIIPGLDPDRNTVQIDIFPTNTIENVVVYKTFTPDLIGDFTGGVVNVETKDFPEEKLTRIQVGVEFNPDMHFKSDFVAYDGSGTDWLAFDDGLRELPIDKNLDIPDISSPQGFLVEGVSRSFEPNMGTKRNSSFLNYAANITHGNQINRTRATWGYNLVLNYAKKYEFYESAQFGEYARNTDPSVNELFAFKRRSGPVGNSDVLWTALASGALKYEKHNYSLMIMHNQNGVAQGTDRVSLDLEDNPANLLDNILTYAQRQVTNGILTGQHNLDKLKIEWRGSLSNSRIYEPDFRLTRIQEIEETDNEGNVSYRYSLNTGVGAGINRFWRDLNEQNQSFKLDLSYPYGEKNNLKVGGLTLWKQRDFEVLNYTYRVRDRGSITFTPDPDDYWKPESIWTATVDEGTFTVARNSAIENAVNSFESTSQTHGFYAMTEHYFGQKFRTIFGVRAEMANMFYTGQNQRGELLDNEKTLDELNWLPSVNLVYEFNDKMNLRASYTKTLARPSFKEKSNAQIYDPLSDRTTIGNLDLGQTDISNYDLRWEYYFTPTEMFSASLFYKQFDGHIETVAFSTAPDQLTYQNAGSSVVYGTELELRKNLTRNLSLGANVSIVKSEIDMNEVIVNESGQGSQTTEKQNREIWAREGEVIEDKRDMVGQAPYLVNAYLNWANENGTLNANVSYNVQGETLTIVGSGRWPDIYMVPFHALNFNIYKDFGPTNNSRITLRMTNLLDAERKNVYKSYEAADRTFSLYQPGRAFAVTYRHTF